MTFEPTGPTDVVRTREPGAPPDTVHSEVVGDLHFHNEYPTDETVDKLFDEFDFQRGCQAFMRNVTAWSMYSFREGLRRHPSTTPGSPATSSPPRPSAPTYGTLASDRP